MQKIKNAKTIARVNIHTSNLKNEKRIEKSNTNKPKKCKI